MHATNIVVEACVSTVDEAVAAAQGGARRLEVCARPDEHGVTPDPLVLHQILARVTIPVVALIRCRPGDFIYSDEEIERMTGQVQQAVARGVEGVAVGALTSDGAIHRRALASWAWAAHPATVIFHRAFDAVRDPDSAFDDLCDFGVARLLTSGGAPTAAEGTAVLRRLVARAGAGLTIVAAGTVRPHSVGQILKETGVREVHARLTSEADTRALVNAALTAGAGSTGPL